MSISTHILDTSRGRPAAGVAVLLEKQHNGAWVLAGQARTDQDGRVASLSAEKAGVFRLRFETGDYFAAQGVTSFYPYVEIVFTALSASQHYHIPLLLAAHGYTTYRGS